MDKRKILIVDDEPLARRNLEQAIADHADWEVAASCRTAEEARDWLAQGGEAHLVLLDIRMPGEGGLSLARHLGELAHPPVVAFVTAYDEYAIDAFELFALDYLQKPFSDRRLGQLLERARGMLALRERADVDLLRALAGDLRAREQGLPPPPIDTFVVKSIGSIERIALNEVHAIRGAGNYVELHLANRTVLHRASLGAIILRLPPDQFLQIHRTSVVRRPEIRSLATDGGERYRIELKSGMTFPVSSRYLAAVRSEIFGRPG